MTSGPEHNLPSDGTHSHDGSTPLRHFRRRPATVWPLPQQRAVAPSPPRPAWLEAAVHRVATTYSRRGSRVLLLAPPAPDRASGAKAGDAEGGTLASLLASAELLSRLNRPADVRALTYPSPTDSSAPQPAAGYRPRLVVSAPLVSPLGPTDHRPDRSGQSVAVGAADRYSLVITPVDSQPADWATRVAWDDLLVPNGILAVITQSDISRRSPGPASRLLAHLSGRGEMALLDRIAFLAATNEVPSGASPATDVGAGAHTELLLLTRVAAAGSRTGVGR